MGLFSILLFSSLAVLPVPSDAADIPPRLVGGAVLSDDWIIRRDIQEEEFKGNVRFDQGPDHAKADWALYRKINNLWNVKGNIYVKKAMKGGETLEAWGDEGEYRANDKLGILYGVRQRLKFQRTFANESGMHVWKGKADSARLDGIASTLALRGSVTMEGDGLLFKSWNASFEQATRAARFEGGPPTALFNDGRTTASCQAEVISVSDQPRRLTATGGVRGWVYFSPPRTAVTSPANGN